MKRAITSHKPNFINGTSSNSSCTTLKNKHSNDTSKSKSGLSTCDVSNASRHHDTRSDISNDENDEPVPIKKRKVSIVHSYANKISDKEYTCTICQKVIHLYLLF